MSDTTHANGGLAGLLSSLAGRAKRLTSHIDGLAIMLVLFAGIITIFKKNWTPDNPWSYAAWFGIALGVAALLYEMRSAKKIASAIYHAKPGSLAAAFFIWLCAFGFSVNNWVGAASEGQADKSNMHKASYFASEDTRKRVKEAETNLARMEADRSKMTPVRSQAEARADIDKAEAHKFFRSTDSCTMTKGPQTRAFCDNYRSAQADLKAWDDISVADGKIENAKAELTEARAAASNTKVETSEARTDPLILTKYAGMSEQDAQIFDGLAAIIAVSIFLSFGSMSAEWERLTAIGPRRRFDFWFTLRRLYSWAMHGTEPKNVTITQHVIDPAGRELSERLKRGFELADRHLLRTA